MALTVFSINPQTMKQETLDLIGRKHTTEQIEEAFVMARVAGFKNINMDLIAGLPGETCQDMEETLAKIQAMGPDSMTIHSLAVKRAAYLNQSRTQFKFTGQAEVNRMNLSSVTVQEPWEWRHIIFTVRKILQAIWKM